MDYILKRITAVMVMLKLLEYAVKLLEKETPYFIDINV